MKKKKTLILLIISTLTIIITMAASIFLWFIIKNKNQHSSVVITTIKEKNIDKENASLFLEKFDEIKTLRNHLSLYFVDKNKIDEFVNYLENLNSVTNANIIIKGIDILGENGDQVKINLSIDGSFNEVLKTIKLLENIPYQVDISDLYITKNDDSNKQLQSSSDDKNVEKFYDWHSEVSFKILAL